MRAIFISYRRQDAEGQAGRLFDDLARHFGDDSVFMDVAGIEPGRDFRRVIDEHVASCGVLLALIGKNWVDARDESGQRRLDDGTDFVRLETASALKREIPVIPVLVQGAHMPRAEQLPPDLAELAYRNGVELTHARWDSDVRVLIKALSAHVEVRAKDAPGAAPAPASSGASPGRMASRVLVAGAALVAVVVAGIMWYQKSPQGTDAVGQAGLPAEARERKIEAQAEVQKQTEPKVAVNQPAVKPDALPAPRPPAAAPAADLCRELDGRSIRFVGNNFHAEIGPAGIKLEEVGLGTFRFETEIVFSDAFRDEKPLHDQIEGVCRNSSVITLDRTLWNRTVHHHTGSLKKGEQGRIEMEGDFQDGGKTYEWSGWIAGPSRK